MFRINEAPSHLLLHCRLKASLVAQNPALEPSATHLVLGKRPPGFQWQHWGGIIGCLSKVPEEAVQAAERAASGQLCTQLLRPPEVKETTKRSGWVRVTSLHPLVSSWHPEPKPRGLLMLKTHLDWILKTSWEGTLQRRAVSCHVAKIKQKSWSWFGKYL